MGRSLVFQLIKGGDNRGDFQIQLIFFEKRALCKDIGKYSYCTSEILGTFLY